jgi:ABC-type nitrate/sulfonate/bicarbonate transport system permease component
VNVAVRRGREWAPALVVFAAGIVLWWGAIRVVDIQQFLLPTPRQIITSFWNERHTPGGWLVHVQGGSAAS